MSYQRMTIKCLGRVFDVEVDSEGTFWATVDADRLEAKTLVQLKALVSAATKKKRISLPAVLLEGHWEGKLTFTPIKFIGFHSNGNMLYRKENGVVEQKSRWGESLLIGGPRGVDTKKAKVLAKAVVKAKNAYDNYLKQFSIAASKEVRAMATGKEIALEEED